MSDQWMQAGPEGAAVPVPSDQVFAPDAPVAAAVPRLATPAEFLRDHLRDAPVMVRESPWTLPDQALRFQRLDEIPQVIAASGNRYFDVGTLAAHGVRLENGIYADRFFILSHSSEFGNRTYTVNWATRAPGDTHIAVQRFDDVVSTPQEAHALAQQAFSNVGTIDSPALDATPRPTRDAGPAVSQQAQTARLQHIPIR
jgi:hypothetical protein